VAASTVAASGRRCLGGQANGRERKERQARKGQLFFAIFAAFASLESGKLDA
jgi:hypothetical protein